MVSHVRRCDAIQQFEWVETLLIAVLGIVMLIELMPIEILTGMKTFVCGMPRSSGGGVQKRPEAAFLCIIGALARIRAHSTG